MTIEIDCQGRESWSRLLSDQLIYRQWFILSCTKPNWVTTPQVCSGIGWLTLENLQSTPTLFSGQRILIFGLAQSSTRWTSSILLFFLLSSLNRNKGPEASLFSYSNHSIVVLFNSSLSFVLYLGLLTYFNFEIFLYHFPSCSSSFMLTVSMTANGLIWIEGLNPSLC